MGPEGKSEYAAYHDGAPTTPGLFPKITMTAESPEREPGRVLPCEPVEITARFKVWKRQRCRGRKRFIKLMMSEGISRGYAQWLADFVRGWMPYGQAWKTHLRRKEREG